MAKAKTPVTAAVVAVRVLSACALGPVNAVVDLTQDEAEHWKAAGVVDDDPDAVAYARSQQGAK
ncbi:MAG TPA: hypothetical protein PKV98_16120 [Burkholderiaceae bacterium]|nr:hypothetical protein [Burkholderiaceae bacterium]